MIVMIILLILCLPLILMLSLYTTTSMVAIAVDVPVSGIEIAIEELIELDLDKGETFTVDYVISPTEASNKNVIYSFEKYGDSKIAELKVQGNTLVPISAGVTKVTVSTVDGDYRDSFFVRVTSSTVSSIESSPVDAKITVGQGTHIETKFYPSTVKNKGLSYIVVDGFDVATVDRDGYIRGIGIGKAKIEVISAENYEARSIFEIEVESSGVIDFINNKASLTALQDPHGSFAVVLNPDVVLSADPTVGVYVDGAPADPSYMTAWYDPSTSSIKYEVLNRLYTGDFEIRITAVPEGGEAVTKSCTVTQVKEVSAAWNVKDWPSDGKRMVPLVGDRLDIDLKPLGADVVFTVHLRHKNGTEETKILTVDEMYVLNEYLSIQIQNSADGACLRAICNKKISPQDLSKGISDVTINLSITYLDGNGEKTINLKEITLFASPT